MNQSFTEEHFCALFALESGDTRELIRIRADGTVLAHADGALVDTGVNVTGLPQTNDIGYVIHVAHALAVALVKARPA